MNLKREKLKWLAPMKLENIYIEKNTIQEYKRINGKLVPINNRK